MLRLLRAVVSVLFSSFLWFCLVLSGQCVITFVQAITQAITPLLLLNLLSVPKVRALPPVPITSKKHGRNKITIEHLHA